MSRVPFQTLFSLVGIVFSASCGPSQITPTSQAYMPNPASLYCEEQGNKLEIVTAPDGSQKGVCAFSHGSTCDEWAYFRGECGPSAATPTAEVAALPTGMPTARPIDPADYQGFWTYTHPDSSFSIMLPEDWVVHEITTSDPLMNGHLLMLRPRLQVENVEGLQIRMTFRRVGEDALLWPTGVGAGQFIQQGTLGIAGQPARRVLFVCPGGEVNAVYYQGAAENVPNIQRGELEFGFILSQTGFYCEEGHHLGGKNQYLGELIIASLKVP
jgi:putative hemolysin